MTGLPLDPRANHDPGGAICLLPLRARSVPAVHLGGPVLIDLDKLRAENDRCEGRAASIEVRSVNNVA